MLRQVSIALSAAVLASACVTAKPAFKEPEKPAQWSATQGFKQSDAKALSQWWMRFDDDALNRVVCLLLGFS